MSADLLLSAFSMMAVTFSKGEEWAVRGCNALYTTDVCFSMCLRGLYVTQTKYILMCSKRLPLLRIGGFHLPEGWSLHRAVVVISSDYLSASGPDNSLHRRVTMTIWKQDGSDHISAAFFCNKRTWSPDATIMKDWAADTLGDPCCPKTLKKPQTRR